jgi:hypothetical protein
MLSLILKDVIIQKKSFVWALVYLIFFIFVFQSLGGTMYIAAVVAFVYLLVSGAFAYDDKYKSDIMLNSLPIKRGNNNIYTYFIYNSNTKHTVKNISGYFGSNCRGNIGSMFNEFNLLSANVQVGVYKGKSC